MSNTLIDIAKQLRDANKKVQLIYAFNGTGKTRLSREFKDLISPREGVVILTYLKRKYCIIVHLQKIYFTGIMIWKIMPS